MEISDGRLYRQRAMGLGTSRIWSAAAAAKPSALEGENPAVLSNGKNVWMLVHSGELHHRSRVLLVCRACAHTQPITTCRFILSPQHLAHVVFPSFTFSKIRISRAFATVFVK